MTAQFVVIEGPNGVGKTTAATLLAKRLRESGIEVHATTVPSDTPPGRVVRSDEAGLSGRALALAVAADRYAHIDAEICPALEAGQLVISDRYVQSSLVLQRLDGLSLTEIWRYNAFVLPATVSFCLQQDPATTNVIARTHQPLQPGFLPFEFGLLETLEGHGFVDAHHHCAPGDKAYSWIGRTGNGYRYDYFHVGPALSGRVDECSYLHETREQRLTDHLVGDLLDLHERPGVLDLVDAQRQVTDRGGPAHLHDPHRRVEPHRLDRSMHLVAIGDLGLVLQAGHLVVHRSFQREQVPAALGAKPGERHPDLALFVRPADFGEGLIVLMDRGRQSNAAAGERPFQRGQVI